MKKQEHFRLIKENLIKDVEKYYQVPLRTPSENYEYFPELDKIVSAKIEDFTKGDISDEYVKMVKEISSEFPGFMILDRFYNQFPSYSISIELLNKMDNDIKSIVWLNIKISLLTNHFTIFFENTNWFANISKYKEMETPVCFVILSGQNKQVDLEGKLIEKLIEIVLESFPSYQFVNHDFLFNNKIDKGIPYRMNHFVNSNINSIYYYLFDNDCHLPVQAVVQ